MAGGAAAGAGRWPAGDGPGLGHGPFGAAGLNLHLIPKLAARKGVFAAGGRIELHSCQPADRTCTVGLAGGRCSDCLWSLADALDVPMMAAERFQYKVDRPLSGGRR